MILDSSMTFMNPIFEFLQEGLQTLIRFQDIMYSKDSILRPYNCWEIDLAGLSFTTSIDISLALWF